MNFTTTDRERIREYLLVASNALKQYATDAYMKRQALHLQRTLEAYSAEALDYRDRLNL